MSSLRLKDVTVLQPFVSVPHRQVFHESLTMRHPHLMGEQAMQYPAPANDSRKGEIL